MDVRMAKNWMWAVLASASLVLAAGCSDDNEENAGRVSDMEPGRDNLTLSDAQIARVVMVANEGEVMLGQLGQSRATDRAVRDFNARMVTEHTAARQRLEQRVQEQGLQPEDSPVSMHLQQEVQRMMAALEQTPARSFDLAMMGSQVAAHARTALTADSLLAPQARNTVLIQELQTQRVDVQKHLRDAVDLHNTLFNATASAP
jgi:putative membrane protein